MTRQYDDRMGSDRGEGKKIVTGSVRLVLRGLSGFLIISSLAIPHFAAVDSGVWALVSLMIGIALMAGIYYRHLPEA